MSAFLEIPSFIFSLVGKFSSAFVLFTGAVLFVPEKLAKAMAIETFRSDNSTVIWLVFLLSLSMLLSYAGKGFWNWSYPLISNWWAKRRRLEVLVSRLASLSEREKLWITCCLYENRQTMNAPITAQPPSALRSKNLLVVGDGHAMDMSFTIPDNIWKYLQSVKSNYIPEELSDRDRRQLEADLQSYRRSLHPY